MARFVVVLLLALTAITLGQSSTATSTTTKPARPLRVLFIGDDYISANGGVYAIVQAMAKSRGHAVECVASSASGKTLQWHRESGGARRLVNDGKWDYVVLQPSPVETTAEAIQLLAIVGAIDAEVHEAGAKTIVLSAAFGFAEPKAQRVFTQGLERLDKKSDASIAPIGAASQTAIAERSGLKLRGASGDQLLPAGTYLAACVLYAMLFDDTADGLPTSITTAAGKTLSIPPADAKVIQFAVDIETSRWVPPTTRPAFGTSEERVVFVVDATGTMLGLKFKIVQEHLRRAVAQLTPHQRFNVVFFQGGDNEDEWRAALALELLAANDANKRKALEFIDRTKVVGKGTNPLAACRLAFGLRPDVIYLVSDGVFDNVVSFEAVVAEVRKLNARRRTRLNTIALMSDDPRGQETLRTLASEHGGRFVRLGEKDLEPATRSAGP